MLRLRRLPASPAAAIGVVGLATIGGGIAGGIVSTRWILRKCDRLSPRHAATAAVATSALLAILLLPLVWPDVAHANLCGTASTVVGKANGLAGTALGLGCNLFGLGGGSGGGSILSGLLHALPKLIPAFLTGVLGWFVGSAVISHLLPGVLHLLVYSPVVLVGDGSQAGRFVTDVVLPVSEGALVSIVLMAAIWYWLVGIYSLDSGAEALTALARAGGAVFAVPIWLWGVPQLVTASNLLSGGLVSQAGDAGSVLGALLGVGAGAGATAGFLEKDLTTMKGFAIGIILIGLALVVFLLLLMAMKVVVAAATVLLFVAFPLSLMVYPLRKLEWLTEGILEAFVVVLLIPIGWALILATMSVVASTLGIVVSLTPPSAHVNTIGGWAGSLLAPMVALVLLWMLVALPRQLIHLALLQTVSRRGFVGDTVHRTAVAVSTDAVRQALPQQLGGYERAVQPAHETTLAGVGAGQGGTNGSGASGDHRAAQHHARDAFATLDDPPGARSRNSDDRTGAGAGTGVGAGTGMGAGAGELSHPVKDGGMESNGTGSGGDGGGRRSSRRLQDMDGFAVSQVDTGALTRGIKQAELNQQINPPSNAQVAQGFALLPEQKRQAVQHALERGDDGAFTAQMVRQSLSSDHPRQQREVFSMLAAAPQLERVGGINEAIRRLEEGESSTSGGDGGR